MTLKHVLKIFSKTEIQEDKTHPNPPLKRVGVNVLCAKHIEKDLFTSKRVAFTLSEVLITIVIVGVVAAITLPIVTAKIKDFVLNKQVEVFRKKFSQSTSKMNTLGKMTAYSSTEMFLNEFSNHYKIIKRCNNNELEKCWPSQVINIPNSTGTLEEKSISSIRTGNDLRALALGTKDVLTSGIISSDGVPMILVYSPRCQMDEVKTGLTTSSCISGIYDINGGKGPNRIGVDVRTINSLYGSVDLGYSYANIPASQCVAVRDQLGASYVPCPTNVYNSFLGALKACNDLKLHLPSRETLATAAGASFGLSNLGIEQNINCWGPHCQNRPAELSVSASRDPSSVSFVGSYWSSVPFIFRETNTGLSLTSSCNAGCTNFRAQSALCVAD